MTNEIVLQYRRHADIYSTQDSNTSLGEDSRGEKRPPQDKNDHSREVDAKNLPTHPGEERETPSPRKGKRLPHTSQDEDSQDEDGPPTKKRPCC